MKNIPRLNLPPFQLALITLGLIALGCLVLAGSLSWHATRQSLNALQTAQPELAKQQAEKALPVAQLASTLTFRQSNALEAWRQGLELVIETPTLLTEWSPFHTNQTTSLSSWLTLARAILDQSSHSWLLQATQPQLTLRLKNATDLLNTATDHVLTGRHTFIIVLQNTEELRATGGFMGSYATLKLNQGQIEDIAIQDIYEPDGQFQGYLEPPTGVKQYLSSGNGLRLPDANWWPDFPSSAQKMLPFFAFGQEQAAEGLIAINLDVVKHLLQVTGPLYIPDYQTTVTADNIADVARADRAEFFPGSKGKPHFLSSLFTQLKIKLSELTVDQKKALVQHFLTDLKHKHIQLYSNHESLQKVWEKYGVAGETNAQPTSVPTDLYLFLVESNVGINKANQGMTRSVKLNLSDYRSQIELTFQNANPASSSTSLTQPKKTAPAEADHLHYINYQRLLLLPQAEIKGISFQGNPIAKWDEGIVIDTNGEQFKQIGFLVEVPEASTAKLSVELTHPPLGQTPLLVLQKQSGLTAVPYEISLNGETRSLLLEKDEVISW